MATPNHGHTEETCCPECQEEVRQLLAEMERLAKTTIPYLIEEKLKAQDRLNDWMIKGAVLMYIVAVIGIALGRWVRP